MEPAGPGTREGGSNAPVEVPGAGGGGPGAAAPVVEVPAGTTPEPGGGAEQVRSEVGTSPTADLPEAESLPANDQAQIGVLNAAGADATVGLPADDSAARWDLSIVITAASIEAWQAIAALPVMTGVFDELSTRLTQGALASCTVTSEQLLSARAAGGHWKATTASVQPQDLMSQRPAWTVPPQAVFKGISELEPGHLRIVTPASSTDMVFWSPRYPVDSDSGFHGSLDDAVEQTRAAL
jgi:hypothetical protein